MQEMRPLQENFLWLNFIYNPNNYSQAGEWTDCDQQWYGPGPMCSVVRTLWPPQIYQYSGNATESPLPLADLNGNPSWQYYGLYDYLEPDFESDTNGGMSIDGNGALVLGSDVRNCFGLKCDSVQIDSLPLNKPGSELNADGTFCFTDFEIPQLHTVDYYFASQTPWFTYGPEGFPSNNPNYPTPALPGSPGFSPTNASPLLIASFGQPYVISDWAKQAISNGYSNRFAYLEQYFDAAYTIVNGDVTTNSAGLLSPYGEFLPTQPGPAALKTMPDIETGQRGTGIVNVIKLQLDVNHDGTMDLSFGGPDNTDQSRPFVFWINNDHDVMSYMGDSGEDVEPTSATEYDCNLLVIPSMRDLEDWARLWVCGVPALPSQGCTVTLSLTAMSGNPAINLVDAVETNGGTLYLTDTNMAYAETFDGSGHRAKYPTITPTTPLTLPPNLFTNAGNKYFLFEGASAGQGQLTMMISQNGTNVLAQTSAWLDLHDIKDLYETALATNVPSGKPPSSLISQLEVMNTTRGMPNESPQVIVFVHGINNPPWNYQNTSETIFKRLYWSGYHGRLAAFRWPCGYFPPNSGLYLYEFNESEFWAYKSAPALKDYLNYLRNRPDLAGYSLNIFAHSQGSAVVSEALSLGATFDNCILTQGAVPAHCYDGSAPTVPALMAAEANMPTPFEAAVGGYDQCWTNIPGNIVNFFNPDDFALVSGSYFWGLKKTNWEINQETQKPEDFASGPAYLFFPASQTTAAFMLFSPDYQVTDWQESRAMVARSHTAAIGAQGPASGRTKQGVISDSVNLNSQFGFGKTRAEHSAQFARPIQTSKPYYDTVVRIFNPPTP